MLLVVFVSYFLVLSNFCVCGNKITVSLNPPAVRLELKQSKSISFKFSSKITENVVIIPDYQLPDEKSPSCNETKHIIQEIPPLLIKSGTYGSDFNVTAIGIGEIVVGFNTSSSLVSHDSLLHCLLRISVLHSNVVFWIGFVIGWIYFAAWTISFYPQVILNFRRKSVTGLNFDFVTYNLLGFICYSAFNVGLYWVKPVQNEYFAEYPRGLIPVALNDVVFAIHAVLVTMFTIFQCIIYDRGGQRVSNVCLVLTGIMILFAVISGILTAVNSLIHTWLEFLYLLSYIKIAITLIKYVPQAWMNYRRKSTVGWSIGNILLDFTGGSFSLIQMFLMAYNNDDWDTVFGNPTKFGLGFISIAFDSLFIVQHYVLYRNRIPYSPIIPETDPLVTDQSVNSGDESNRINKSVPNYSAI